MVLWCILFKLKNLVGLPVEVIYARPIYYVFPSVTTTMNIYCNLYCMKKDGQN